MKLRIMAFLLLGAVLSVMAGFGTYRYTSALEAELATARDGIRVYGDTRLVPVAKGDFARGARLDPGDFRQIGVPVTLLPANVLTALPTAPDGGGLVALRDLRQGALMLQADLAAAGQTPPGGPLPAQDGSAIALTALNLADLLPILQVGSSVDLVWTRPTGGGTSESRLIGTALRVLDLFPAAPAGSSVDPPGPNILLEGPRAALLPLIQAERAGSFHLLLSNGSRDISAKVLVVGHGDLAGLPLLMRDGTTPAGGAPAGSTRPAARQICQTAVIRGGARSVVEVPC